MTIEMTRKALLCCAVINYGILLVWFLFFVLAHDRMYLLHKIGILLLNLVPYVALHIMRRTQV